jgi:hypothetical protein
VLAALVSVPEATVDEDRESEVSEDEIRSAWQIGRMLGELELQGPQHALALVLCGRPCRMHGPHDLATLGLGEGVQRMLNCLANLMITPVGCR